MQREAWYKRLWSFFVETWNYWSYYRPSRMASSLSYYGLFALVPLLVITFWIGSLVITSGTLEADIINRAAYILGPASVSFLQTTFNGALSLGKNPIIAIITVAILLFLAVTGFDELKQSLDELWETPRELKMSILATLSRYIISLVTMMVFAIIFITFIILAKFFQAGFTFGISAGATHIITLIGGPILIFVICLIGAFLVYLLLPDRPMPNRHLLAGAALTAFFLTIGNLVLGYYLTSSVALSAYGIAGSIVAVLLWFYYSSLIFLFGASATWIYNKRVGVKDKTLIKFSSWLQLNIALGVSQQEDDEMFEDYRAGNLGYSEWQKKILGMYLERGKATKETILKTLHSYNYIDGAEDLVQDLKKKGYKLALISGSIDLLVQTIAQELGFDYWAAHNTFLFDENDYISDIISNGDDVDSKPDFLKKISRETGISVDQMACVGDGENDRGLFLLTKKGVTFSDAPIKDIAWKVVDKLSDIKTIF
jgi:membrane protein